MIETLQQRVNADAALVRRGRYLTTTFLLEVGQTAWLIAIFEGRIVSVTPGPFVMPSSSLCAARAREEEWEKFWSSRPPPGSNDLMALIKRRVLKAEGNLQIFMANLRYFKEALGQAAPDGSGGMSAQFEPITGRYMHLDLFGRQASHLCRGGRRGHAAACACTPPAPTGGNTAR